MTKSVVSKYSIGSIIEAAVYYRNQVKSSSGNHSIIEAKSYGKKKCEESFLSRWTKREKEQFMK